MTLKKAIQYLAYLALRVAEMLILIFPVRTMYAVFQRLGDGYWSLSRRRQNRAIEHLRRSFPQMTPAQLRSCAKESMRSMFCMGLEVLHTTRRITEANWRKHIELHNVGETLRTLLEERSGLILVGGHFGNWEIVGYTLAVLGFPSVAVARPLDNPYISEHVMGIRERTGLSVLYKLGATESMHDVLERRGVLGFIADQDAGPKGIFVDFLGRPASTYKSVALMAIRHNCPVAVGYGRRIGTDYRFELAAQRIIYPREWADKGDPLTWLTQQYTAALGEAVRSFPDQYVWTHRRWRTRPDGSIAQPDGIA